MEALVRWDTYHDRELPDQLITACKVTEENMIALTLVLKEQRGFIANAALQFDLDLDGGRVDHQIAEPGDYLITDNAGKCVAVDKEIFEYHFTN